MKVADIFEASLRPRELRGGYYQMPNYPTSSNRGQERLYNFVIPQLAKELGLSKGRIRYTNVWDTTSGAFSIIFVKDVDQELLDTVLPVLVKKLMSQSHDSVETEEVKWSSAFHGGKMRQIAKIKYTAKYPQAWKDLDKRWMTGI